MEGQKALRFHQKDLHLCSEDEQKSYRSSSLLKNFADNLLTPMSSKMSMSFFHHQKEINVFNENIPGFFSI